MSVFSAAVAITCDGIPYTPLAKHHNVTGSVVARCAAWDTEPWGTNCATGANIWQPHHKTRCVLPGEAWGGSSADIIRTTVSLPWWIYSRCNGGRSADPARIVALPYTVKLSCLIDVKTCGLPLCVNSKAQRPV